MVKISLVKADKSFGNRQKIQLIKITIDEKLQRLKILASYPCSSIEILKFILFILSSWEGSRTGTIKK